MCKLGYSIIIHTPPVEDFGKSVPQGEGEFSNARNVCEKILSKFITEGVDTLFGSAK